MKHFIYKSILMFCLAVAAWLWNGDISPNMGTGFVASAEAVIGRPATPVSYAGVARRTTRRAVAVGGPTNRGGPVNRVGRR